MGELTAPRPLAAEDDRLGFECGRSSIEIWFQRHAWRNQLNDASRTSVLPGDRPGEVAAFVAVSAGEVRRGYLPKSEQRNQPDPLPILLLGQLAVDTRYQGRGYARSLMVFVYGTAARLSREIGCFGILTHPLDDGVRPFYRQFGFRDLPDDPKRAMLVRMKDVIHNGFG